MSRISALLSRLGNSGGLLALTCSVGLIVIGGLCVLADLPKVAIACVLVSILGESLMERKAPAVTLLLNQADLGAPMRFAARLVVGLLAGASIESASSLKTLVVVATVETLILGGRALHHEYRLVGPLKPMNTRNIPGSPAIAVLPPARDFAVVASQLLVLAPALLGANWWLVGVIGVAGAGWLGAVTVPDAFDSWRMRQAKRATGFTPPLRAIQDFLDDYQPEVLLHLSGPPGSAYQVNTWLESLEYLDRRVLIVLRDHVLFTTMQPTTLPVLELSAASELLMLDFASVKVALYPTNTGNNIHLLRLPHMMSAFVGHGDSDKSASANPFSRVYDELWVAGEAGADRYRKSGLGIHESQFRFVGRPQVHHITSMPHLGDEDVPTVLYAPTWEGVNQLQEYSSTSAIGETIVKALLASKRPVRVVYKPHPFTGQRDAKYRAASARISGLLAAAAAESSIDHRTVRDGSIYEWMNTSTAMITDISSVISDYLASEKPIAVFNHTGRAEPLVTADEFVAEFPSAAAATILGPDGEGIEGFVDVVTQRTDDSLADARSQLATYLLGPAEKRTLDSFEASIEAFIERAETERAQYTP